MRAAGSTMLSFWLRGSSYRNPWNGSNSTADSRVALISAQAEAGRGWADSSICTLIKILPPRTTWREISCWGFGETVNPSFAISHSYMTVDIKGHWNT